MRLWLNAKGDLISDEQVLACLASHGSLSAALSAGDITLVTGGTEAIAPRDPMAQRKGKRRHAKLAEYL